MNILKIAKTGVVSLTIALAMGFATPNAVTAQTHEINRAIKQLSEAMGDRSAPTNARSAFEAGEKLYNKGDPASLRQAIPLFQQSVKLSRTTKEEQMLGLALLALGSTHSRLNETANAIAPFEEVASLLPRLSLAPEQKQKLQEILGMLYIQNQPKTADQNPQQTRQEIEHAISRFDAADCPESKAYALLYSASSPVKADQYQDAKANLTTVIGSFQQFKDAYAEATSLMLLGMTHAASAASTSRN